MGFVGRDWFWCRRDSGVVSRGCMGRVTISVTGNGTCTVGMTSGGAVTAKESIFGRPYTNV